MSNQSMFARENKIIEDAELIISSTDFINNPLFDPYCDLLHEYKKLLRQTKRLVKAKEMMQSNLNDMNTDLQTHKEILAQMSYADGLTSIANRRQFNNYIEYEWNRGLRSGRPLSLIFLDIDFFKLYNDHYGHRAGDECLLQIAQAIKKATKRSSDLAARYGGEEFALLLPETELSGAMAAAALIQQTIKDRAILHEYSPIASIVTVSIGVASMVPGSGLSAQDLFKAVDRQLHAAKKAGRNQIKSLDS